MPTEASEYKKAPEPKETREPTTWYVVLHLVDGKVQPQLEWWREMKVNDRVQFISPDGEVQVKFTPKPAKDIHHNDVKDLYPFGKENIIIHDPEKARCESKTYRVVHSCKSLMTCSIIKDGVIYTWKGALAPSAPPEEAFSKEYEEGGTHICTGGGLTPVVCGP